MIYILVRNSRPSQIEDQVNRYLEEGYKLAGPLIVDSKGTLIQPLIKEN